MRPTKRRQEEANKKWTAELREKKDGRKWSYLKKNYREEEEENEIKT